jgi:hypothetical protein
MIEVMEDEDDHVLERHYTIDHVYQSKIINRSKFILTDVYILQTEENTMKFFDYLIGKSIDEKSLCMKKNNDIDLFTLNHVNHL